jgi:hypothetical protein
MGIHDTKEGRDICSGGADWMISGGQEMAKDSNSFWTEVKSTWFTGCGTSLAMDCSGGHCNPSLALGATWALFFVLERSKINCSLESSFKEM